MSTPALEVTGVTGGYGNTVIVRDISFAVGKGEIVALLGPNGAGKTTTLSLVSGILPMVRGKVTLDGVSVEGWKPAKIARTGLNLVPEDRGIFGQLTVAENIRLARSSARGLSLDEILDHFPKLRELMKRRAALLSGGEQQMLALAKGIAMSPQVLLVDELSMGLAPIIVDSLFETVRHLSRSLGIATILVEQHVDTALQASDRAIVISRGRVACDMPSAELIARRDVLQTAYLSADSAADSPAETILDLVDTQQGATNN